MTMVDTDETFLRIKQIMTTSVPLEDTVANTITPKTSIARDKDTLGLDSLDAVETVMAIEDHYKVNIPDDELNRLQNLGGLARYIEKQCPNYQDRNSTPFIKR